MRLQCPRCAAQYEIADELIPDSGREVECAVCAEIWLAGRAEDREGLEGEREAVATPPDDDGEVTDSPEPPRNVRLQRELPADVLDVLLSEADRERRARRRTRAMKEAATGAAGRRAEDGSALGEHSAPPLSDAQASASRDAGRNAENEAPAALRRAEDWAEAAAQEEQRAEAPAGAGDQTEVPDPADEPNSREALSAPPHPDWPAQTLTDPDAPEILEPRAAAQQPQISADNGQPRVAPEGQTKRNEAHQAASAATPRDLAAQDADADRPPPPRQPASTAPAGTAPASTSPASTSPAVTSPAVTSPAVTSPAVTSPAVTSPAVTSPAVTSPAVTSPAGAAKPAPAREPARAEHLGTADRLGAPPLRAGATEAPAPAAPLNSNQPEPQRPSRRPAIPPLEPLHAARRDEIPEPPPRRVPRLGALPDVDALAATLETAAPARDSSTAPPPEAPARSSNYAAGLALGLALCAMIALGYLAAAPRAGEPGAPPWITAPVAAIDGIIARIQSISRGE